jgi:hypothetical protein
LRITINKARRRSQNAAPDTTQFHQQSTQQATRLIVIKFYWFFRIIDSSTFNVEE